MDRNMVRFIALCVFNFTALCLSTFGFLYTVAVAPEALMFRKCFCSPKLACHATGFFPKGLNITWQKDGEDLIEDVELRKTLPNQNGSFQKKSILKGSPEDLQEHKYSIFEHGSLKGAFDLVVPDPEVEVPLPIVYAVGGFVTFINSVAGIFLWMKKPGFRPASSKAGELQRGA